MGRGRGGARSAVDTDATEELMPVCCERCCNAFEPAEVFQCEDVARREQDVDFQVA